MSSANGKVALADCRKNIRKSLQRPNDPLLEIKGDAQPGEREEQIDSPLNSARVVVIPEQSGTQDYSGKTGGQGQEGNASLESEPAAAPQRRVETRKC